MKRKEGHALRETREGEEGQKGQAGEGRSEF